MEIRHLPMETFSPSPSTSPSLLQQQGLVSSRGRLPHNDSCTTTGCSADSSQSSTAKESSSGGSSSCESSGGGSSSKSSRMAMPVNLSISANVLDASEEIYGGNTKGGRFSTSARCWLSPGGVAVPPAPPSSPESLLVLPAHMKSDPFVLTLDSAAAAAAALAHGNSSSSAVPTPDNMHTASVPLSVSTCSSRDRNPSSNVQCSLSVVSDGSCPPASRCSSPLCASSVSPSCTINTSRTVRPQTDCLSGVCIPHSASMSPPSNSTPPRDAAIATAEKAMSKPHAEVVANAPSAQCLKETLTGSENSCFSEAIGTRLSSDAARDLTPSGVSAPFSVCPLATLMKTSYCAHMPALANSAGPLFQDGHAVNAPTKIASVPAETDSAAAGRVSVDAESASTAAGSASAGTPVALSAAAVAEVSTAPGAGASPSDKASAGNSCDVPGSAKDARFTASVQSDERPAIVVLDTGAFLRLQQLRGGHALLKAEQHLLSRRRQQHYSATNQRQRRIRFVAPASVLREIRDARTRALALQQQQWASAVTDSDLPFVMTATEADKRWARRFAAKTGDLRALSTTDLDVIALTYMLQRQTGQVQHLRDEPVDSVCLQRGYSDSSAAVVGSRGVVRIDQRIPAARIGETATAERYSRGESDVASAAKKLSGSAAAGSAGTTAEEAPKEATATEKATTSEERTTAEEGTGTEDSIAEESAVPGVDRRDAAVAEAREKDGDDAREETGDEKRFPGEGTEEAEQAIDARTDKKPDLEPEAIAAFAGLREVHGGAASGIFTGGVQETRKLVEFDSDEDDDEGEWISFDNIEQLKRNASACQYEESGFPSTMPRHDAGFAEVPNNREGDTQSFPVQGQPGKEKTQLDAHDGFAGKFSSNTKQTNNSEEESLDFLVACKTMDYSVQNVLLHMGLNVLAVDGYAVRSLKTWALLCRACTHVTRDTSHLFCPKCGQHAVDRVPVSFNGKEYVVFDNRKKKCTRGLVHSLPKPKGGRHEKQLILAEDQLMMGGRDRILRHQQRMWESENAEHNFFGTDSAMDPASWYARTRTRTGCPATGVQAPHAVVGLGPGNPNSNRWMKKHRTARPGKSK